jgi:hypothetical protein
MFHAGYPLGFLRKALQNLPGIVPGALLQDVLEVGTERHNHTLQDVFWRRLTEAQGMVYQHSKMPNGPFHWGFHV